jgi:glyoxylase-like metal-dependent hydrolase (beta-lactamase superfamily II)
VELREIARDVFACLQEDRGLGFSNSGFVNAGGGLVVDTFWDLPHTRELIAHYARVWGEPARRVVNTHANGDHCWGNQLFPQAEIVGHRRCAEEMRRESPAALQQLKQSGGSSRHPGLAGFARALAPWDFTGIELRPPTTLVDDALELDLGGIRARVEYVGPAHTGGDVIVHLPERGVVFTGDVLFRLCTPIGWVGTTRRWCAALDRIASLGAETLVPGHGPLCGPQGALEMKAYLEYVLAESRRFFEAGLTPAEAALKLDLGPYAGWTEPERIVFNVHRAYRELRGEPEDAPVDTLALFREVFELRKAWGAD